MSEIDAYKPHPDWKPPWKGRTVWLAYEVGWDWTTIYGVAASPEAAMDRIRKSKDAQIADDSFLFWHQDADGWVHDDGGRFDIRPEELAE